MKELIDWQTFYEIVGSSAGALIGLQFVLISLIARLPLGQEGAQASSVFSTPTVVHFTVVLLLAGAGSAPWHRTAPLAGLWFYLELPAFSMCSTSIDGCRLKPCIGLRLRTGSSMWCYPSLHTA